MPDELAQLLADAAAAWPTFEVDAERFAQAVAERAGDEPPAALALDDLYLACACADGIPAALAAFETVCGPAIEHAIATMRVPSADRSDVAQIVRERLLVAKPGQPPRIATYSARGALASWVRVVASREAARLLPRAVREPIVEDGQLARMLDDDDDPELAHLKRHYRDELQRAFAAAVAALGDHARLVLRQHVIDKLGIDQLAALHGVHRSTCARWIEAARAEVLAATQRELLRHLRITRDELASIVRLIASQLDLSLTHLLR